jgi:hypothetical protein
MRIPAFALLLLGLGMLAGCGGGGPKLIPVEGTVFYTGKPLAAGTVIFYPDTSKGNASKEEPRGSIDAQGHYEVMTGAKKGASPGWYKVAVNAAEQIDPKNPYFTKWLIPERYIDHRTSKLTVEIVENPAPGAYDFKLEAK